MVRFETGLEHVVERLKAGKNAFSITTTTQEQRRLNSTAAPYALIVGAKSVVGVDDGKIVIIGLGPAQLHKLKSICEKMLKEGT